MLAILSAPTFDPAGHVQLRVLPQSADFERRRRVSRVATLDGGAALNDGGYSAADITITLTWPVRDATTGPAVERLVQLYGTLVLSMAGVLYTVAVESYSPGGATSSMTLLVTEQLAPV